MSTPLDSLLDRAHALDVHADHARLFVADLQRWERRQERTPRRWPAFLGGVVATVMVAAVLLFVLRTKPSSAQPVQIGARVAVLGGPDARYTVAELGPDRTVLDLTHGMVTARVFPGDPPHVVVLRGGGIEASGAGTVSLAIGAIGASGVVASANDGAVEVRRGDEHFTIAAGAAWPERATAIGRAQAYELVAMQLAPVEHAVPATPIDAPIEPVPVDIPVDAPRPPAPAPVPVPHRVVVNDAGPERQVPPDAAPTSVLTERWHAARLFRSQGKFDQSIDECLAIADAKDPTWSPIALVEAARIALGPKAAPERALEYVDRFMREWPKNSLAAEGRDLRCRALAQLGRAAECTTSAKP